MKGSAVRIRASALLVRSAAATGWLRRERHGRRRRNRDLNRVAARALGAGSALVDRRVGKGPGADWDVAFSAGRRDDGLLADHGQDDADPGGDVVAVDDVAGDGGAVRERGGGPGDDDVAS